MLLGSNNTGLGVSQAAAPPKEGATAFFMGFSIALMIAVNVRLFGTIWAVLMVALCLAILYLGRVGMISRVLRQPILVLLPSFFALSCLWSSAFMVSLSLGLQTLLVTLTAITIAQCTTNRQLLHIIFYATSATCIACLLHGGKGPSEYGPVLAGFLGSKNAMGLFAYLSAITSLAVLMDRDNSLKLRAVALVCGLMELWIVMSVHATTAVIALALGTTVFFTTYFILSKSKLARWVTYFLIVLLMMMVWLFGPQLAEIFVQITGDYLGKDATLTGRTRLWEKARLLFNESPLLGNGYRAYWVGESLDVRRMLYEMHTPDGRGFNFHQQYLEILADTGIIGATILGATFVVFFQRIWRSTVVNRSCFSAYSFAVLIVFIVQWFFETALLPFSFSMMMFYGLGAAAMRPKAAGVKSTVPLVGLNPAAK